MSRRDGVRPKTDMSPSAPLGSQARGEVAKREVWTDGGRDWVGVLPGPPARVGGRLVLCPTPGRAPRPCLRGAGPGPMLAAPMRGGREKDRGKPALNEAHRAAPHSAEGTQRHSMRTRGVTHVPGVRGPPSLHPHHPGALWPPPWRARAPSGEPGVSGDFWGSQEGCQGPFRPWAMVSMTPKLPVNCIGLGGAQWDPRG